MIRWIVIGLCWFVAFVAQGARLYLQQSSILVHDQPIGDTFVVDQVRTPGAGVLVVVNSIYGKPYYEHVLDRTDLPQAGTYTNIQLSVAPQYSFAGAETPEGTQGVLTAGDLVFAVLMVPSASSGELMPMRTLIGKPIARPFRLL